MSVTDTGFTSAEVCQLAGISYRQLDYWCHRSPDLRHQRLGSGYQREFSTLDLAAFCYAADLLACGYSPQAAVELGFDSARGNRRAEVAS